MNNELLDLKKGSRFVYMGGWTYTVRKVGAGVVWANVRPGARLHRFFLDEAGDDMCVCDETYD